MQQIPIFISYGHFDDEPSPGWVSAFKKQLDIRLKQYIGEDVFTIWLDTQIPGHADNWARIEQKLSAAQVLVSIVSKRYVRSPSCWHEVIRYFEQWHEGLWVDQDTARLFKVVKLPITHNEVPPDVSDELKSVFMDKLNGYPFYKILNDRGAFRELDADLDKREYLDQLSDLAFALANFVQRLRGENEAPRRFVYLAETTPDLAASRDKIRRELTEHGFAVLPQRPINWNSVDYADQVREDINRSELTVHLIGPKRGIVPDETTQLGIGTVQLDLSLTAARPKRIVWLPDGITRDAVKREEHWKYIQQLIDGGLAHRGVDVVRGTDDDLKIVIHDALAAGGAGPEDATVPSAERPKVFVIFHESDADAASAIVGHLTTEGFDTFTPMFDGDNVERLKYHRDLLADCDGVLLYQGAAPDAWFKPNDLDLLKTAGYSAARRVARAEYLGPPETIAKKVLNRGNLRVIKTFGGVDTSALSPFVEDVAKAYASNRDAVRAR